MSAPWKEDEHVLDLLAREATEGLSREEARELEALLRRSPGARVSLEPAVGALLAAAAAPREKLPGDLRQRILAAAPASDAAPLPGRGSSSRALPASAGWWAAAASLLLAVAGWWPRLTGEREQVVATPADPQAQRETMLEGVNVVRVNLTAASDAPLTGDVVFDPVNQTGFLRFRGIPANDPRLSQYQLWIADAGRDPPEPVDGGVFDVPQANADGDVIIPFHAKLPVGKPAAFVITLEQPGGVVVSRQERVMALAKVL